MATIQDEISLSKVVNGVSIINVFEEYYVSTSSTDQVGGEWTTTVPNNTNPNLYVWRRVKNELSNGSIVYTAPALIAGMTGTYPIVSELEPENPKEGQQWWQSDAAGNIIKFSIFENGAWAEQTIEQSVLNIIKLNAVKITASEIKGTTVEGGTITGTEVNGGTVTGTTIKGSLISNEVDYRNPSSGAGVVVNLALSNGRLYENRVIYENKNTLSEISEIELSAGLYDQYLDKETVGLLMQSQPVGLTQPSGFLLLTPDGIRFLNNKTSSKPGWEMFMSAEDTIKAPAVGLTAASGFSRYSTSSTSQNFPTARRVGRLVQLAGAFKNNETATYDATGVDMCTTLPDWARPATNVNFVVQGTEMNRFLLAVTTDGKIQISRYGTTGYTSANAGAWLNIACTYSAADI